MLLIFGGSLVFIVSSTKEPSINMSKPPKTKELNYLLFTSNTKNGPISTKEQLIPDDQLTEDELLALGLSGTPICNPQKIKNHTQQHVLPRKHKDQPILSELHINELISHINREYGIIKKYQFLQILNDQCRMQSADEISPIHQFFDYCILVSKYGSESFFDQKKQIIGINQYLKEIQNKLNNMKIDQLIVLNTLILNANKQVKKLYNIAVKQLIHQMNLQQLIQLYNDKQLQNKNNNLLNYKNIIKNKLLFAIYEKLMQTISVLLNDDKEQMNNILSSNDISDKNKIYIVKIINETIMKSFNFDNNQMNDIYNNNDTYHKIITQIINQVNFASNISDKNSLNLSNQDSKIQLTSLYQLLKDKFQKYLESFSRSIPSDVTEKFYINDNIVSNLSNIINFYNEIEPINNYEHLQSINLEKYVSCISNKQENNHKSFQINPMTTQHTKKSLLKESNLTIPLIPNQNIKGTISRDLYSSQTYFTETGEQKRIVTNPENISKSTSNDHESSNSNITQQLPNVQNVDSDIISEITDLNVPTSANQSDINESNVNCPSNIPNITDLNVKIPSETLSTDTQDQIKIQNQEKIPQSTDRKNHLQKINHYKRYLNNKLSNYKSISLWTIMVTIISVIVDMYML
jgi:hypothetical protein